jgi:hypothetical protein
MVKYSKSKTRYCCWVWFSEKKKPAVFCFFYKKLFVKFISLKILVKLFWTGKNCHNQWLKKY